MSSFYFGESMPPACLLSPPQWMILPACFFLYCLFASKMLFSFAFGLLRFLLAMGYHGTNSTVLDPSANTQLSINCWIFSCWGQLFWLISIWGFYATIPWRMTEIPKGFIGISQLLLSAANAVMCQVQLFIEFSCFLGFEGLSINIKIKPCDFSTVLLLDLSVRACDVLVSQTRREVVEVLAHTEHSQMYSWLAGVCWHYIQEFALISCYKCKL